MCWPICTHPLSQHLSGIWTVDGIKSPAARLVPVRVNPSTHRMSTIDLCQLAARANLSENASRQSTEHLVSGRQVAQRNAHAACNFWLAPVEVEPAPPHLLNTRKGHFPKYVLHVLLVPIRRRAFSSASSRKGLPQCHFRNSHSASGSMSTHPAQYQPKSPRSLDAVSGARGLSFKGIARPE